jgi:hypothetical protein
MHHRSRAISEQLRTLISPEPGLSESPNKGTVTFSQITGYRRRPENIMVTMIDDWTPKGQTIHVKRVRGPHRRAAKRNKERR